MNCERTTTKTVNLGRLPVYCGPYVLPEDSDGYHKYNIVSYQGSSFINLVEGNKKEPVNIKYDSSGLIESYSLSADDGSWLGWMFVANALDAKQWGEKAKFLVENNFFALEFLENGDIEATYGLGGQIERVYTEGNGDISMDMIMVV